MFKLEAHGLKNYITCKQLQLLWIWNICNNYLKYRDLPITAWRKFESEISRTHVAHVTVIIIHPAISFLQNNLVKIQRFPPNFALFSAKSPRHNDNEDWNHGKSTLLPWQNVYSSEPLNIEKMLQHPFVIFLKGKSDTVL